MKIITIIILFTILLILICLPEFTAAQEMVTKENNTVNPNDQASAPQSPAASCQRAASVDPANASRIELNALYAGSKSTADPELHSEIKQTEPLAPGVVGGWRERIFNSLKAHFSPRQSDIVNDSRMLSKTELDEEAHGMRVVSTVVLKETLQFTRERVPEIDKLVNALKFEVSNRTSGEDVEAEAKDKKSVEAEAGGKNIAKYKTAKDKFLVKTGLRVPVESGKLGLVSETEAKYGDVASFFIVKLDGQYENSLGLKYKLGKNTHLQVERQVIHAADAGTTTLNLVQLVRQF